MNGEAQRLARELAESPVARLREKANRLIELLDAMKPPPAAEGTSYPFWAIIDPAPALVVVDPSDVEPEVGCEGDGCYFAQPTPHDVAHCITGGFYSRDDAQAHLGSKHYNYSADALVYCFSGHASAEHRKRCKGSE